MMEGAAGPSRPQDEQAPAQSDERMAVLQTTTAGVAERARRVCSGSGLRDCITCGPHNCTHDRTLSEVMCPAAAYDRVVLRDRFALECSRV